MTHTSKLKAPPIVYVVETEYWLENEAWPENDLCLADDSENNAALLTSTRGVRIGVRSSTGHEVRSLLELD